MIIQKPKNKSKRYKDCTIIKIKMFRNIITSIKITNITKRYCHSHSKTNFSNYNCKYSVEDIKQIKTQLSEIEHTMAYMYIVNTFAILLFYLI
jgi:hypothetical protein